MGTLTLHSNQPLYISTVTGTLTADGWTIIMLHLVQRGGASAGCGPTQSPLFGLPNVTAHPSMASVPTSYYWMWHCNWLMHRGRDHLLRT